MNRIFAVAVAAAMLGLTGCATGAKAYMDSPLANKSEPASVWNRPQEVGFDWGSEISAEVTNTCVLGFICWGYEDGGLLDIGAIIGALTGAGKQVDDPLVRAAAAVAVANTPKADGIFVVSHDTDLFNIFIYKKRTARVRGKAFSVRPIGEVSEARADRVRNLRSLGNSMVTLPDLTK